MREKRVVVTGIGTVNPLGNNYDEFITNLFDGKMVYVLMIAYNLLVLKQTYWQE